MTFMPAPPPKPKWWQIRKRLRILWARFKMWRGARRLLKHGIKFHIKNIKPALSVDDVVCAEPQFGNMPQRMYVQSSSILCPKCRNIIYAVSNNKCLVDPKRMLYVTEPCGCYLTKPGFDYVVEQIQGYHEYLVEAAPELMRDEEEEVVHKIVTEAEFEQKTGQAPINDDLDRVNCPTVGGFGHYMCGWCEDHDKPRTMCGCIQQERLNA